jgi:Ger(x)C family germination protein
MLSGCWDTKGIQDTNYVATIGCDFVDDKYVIVAQLLDFTFVAKQEGGKSSQNAIVWTGSAKGDTVIDAMNALYETSQQRMYWGQVSAFVFTERAIAHGIDEFKEGFIRFREIRYTQWVFGTKEPLDRVLSVLPFFSQSPLNSILQRPVENYQQRSFVRPLQLYEVIAKVREPGATLLLPSLAISEDAWKKNNTNDPKLYIDGVFAISHYKPPVWMNDKDLGGLRWFDPHTLRAKITVEHDGNPGATLSAYEPKADWRFEQQGLEDGIAYSVHIKASFILFELLQPLGKEQLERAARQKIAEEIKHTFQFGLQKQLDLYQLNHRLYHGQFKLWKELTHAGQNQVEELTLKSVDVSIRMKNSGMYKWKGDGSTY